MADGDDVDERLSRRFDTPVENDDTPVENDDTPVENDDTPVENDDTPVEDKPDDAVDYSQKAQNKSISQNTQNDMNSSTSQSNSATQTSQNVRNVKKEWNVRSFYLDDNLDGKLVTAFKRLDLELDESDSELSIKKTRHFYPLIVQLGLEQLESMDASEITERLED